MTFKQILTRAGQRARWGLAAGAVAIVAAVAVLGTWLLRTEEEVLFADLRPQDAALMVAELDRQKVPYRIGPDGGTILVDRRVVHATRLRLMGKDMPLHGAAGFELFNSGDFGMTEFAQKINYQRALQGEITRTILALSEVREARVHLALPEEGLFKRSQNKPKAAITLGLRPGEALRPDQVSGIQRLVAGAVPGIAAQDVTIVDQRGVALTRAAAAEGEVEASSGRLDLKRETERHLTRKATEVLERAFGAGQAMASVDVTLNMDQVKITTEDVVAAPAAPGQVPTGVLVREREVVRDAGSAPAQPDAAGRAGSTQREVEYQVGRRIEQVITQPGAVRRIHVAAVVRHSLDAQQLEQARALVTAAVGGVLDRGDSIVVQSLKAFDGAAHDGADAAPAPGNRAPVAAPAAVEPLPEGAWIALAALVLVCASLLAWRWPRHPPAPAALTERERQAMLAQVRAWLQEGGR